MFTVEIPSRSISLYSCAPTFCPQIGTISVAHGARISRDQVSILVLLFLWSYHAFEEQADAVKKQLTIAKHFQDSFLFTKVC